jgi:hypothetical protein
MNKKLRVRVSHFLRDKYKVEYFQDRMFRGGWIELKFFYGFSKGGSHGWSLNLWCVEGAERIAESLKTLDDVRKYYATYEEEERVYNEKETAWKKRVKPYAVREFN